MPKADNVLAQVREICLSLPDTCETPTWGKPHFRVQDKIFAGCGEEKGILSIGFKLHMEHAADIIRDARFRPAPYVGHKGWISMDAAGVRDWDEVRALIHESYELIAPKRTLAKWAAMPAPARSKPAASQSAPVARKTATKASKVARTARKTGALARTARKKATKRLRTE